MDAIDLSKFRQLPMDSGLAGTANRIFKAGVGIREAGTDIASTWKGLSGPYKGPGAGRLIGAVGPVQAHADRFGWEVGQVGTALRDFAGELGPLRAKLDQLHQQAVQLHSEQLADPHWRKKQSMVDRHNQLLSSEAITWNQVVLAAGKCASRINQLIGGVQYHPSTDGKVDSPGELGYDPRLLPAKLPKGVKTDWGTTVGRDKPWWEDGWDGAGGFLHGLVVDGPVEFGKGIAGMAGFVPDAKGDWHWDWHNSWETYKTAGAMGLGGLVGTPVAMSLPGATRRGIEGWKNLGKGFIAFDDWGKDKGRAAGKVSFNILTLGIPETRLGMAGRGGDIALATTRAMAKADLFNRGITFGIRSGIRGASAGIDGATRLAGHIADMPKIRSMLPSLYRLDTAAGRLPHSPVGPPHDPPTAQPAHTAPKPHTPTSGAAHDAPDIRRRDPNDLLRVRDLVDRIGKPYERPMHDLDRRIASHPPAEHTTTPGKRPSMAGVHDDAPSSHNAPISSSVDARGHDATSAVANDPRPLEVHSKNKSPEGGNPSTVREHTHGVASGEEPTARPRSDDSYSEGSDSDPPDSHNEENGENSRPRLIRRDDNFSSDVNYKGQRKAHLDSSGNLIPANPDGTSSIIDHIVGKGQKKSDSPFISLSREGASTAKVFGWNHIIVDLSRLENDIAAGRVRGVEVYSPEQVQGVLQKSADRIAGRHVDITLPSNASRSDVDRMARSFGLDNAATKRIKQRIVDMMNTRRDEEWLIRGVVPREYIYGPFGR